MRGAVIEALLQIAGEDERTLLLTADLGFTVVEPFAEAFPSRFLNCGVAEQNMVGVATGLAEAGYVPYLYSIATFATLRPYEFIRNGPLLHGLPVRILGVGGGLDYGHNGITHYALEDIAIMRAQPGMTVVAPGSPRQAAAALRTVATVPGPVYVRVGREGADIPGVDDFELGRIHVVRRGSDLVLLALGPMIGTALEAADRLAAQSIDACVVLVASLAPVPVADLDRVLGPTRLAVTVEDHYIVGGLGSLVAETIAEKGLGCRLVRCGVREMVRGITGSREFLHATFGLDAAGVAEASSRAYAGLR